MNQYNKRLTLIENNVFRFFKTEFPNDNDNFIRALGVSPANYVVGNNAYDFLQALSDTAIEDWEDSFDVL